MLQCLVMLLLTISLYTFGIGLSENYIKISEIKKILDGVRYHERSLAQVYYREHENKE